MFRFGSFFFSSTGTLTDETQATLLATGLSIGITIPPAAIQGTHDAIRSALAVDPTGNHHPKTFTVAGGPDVVYAAMSTPEDPTDDTVTVGGLVAWSRTKAAAFCDGLEAYGLATI